MQDPSFASSTLVSLAPGESLCNRYRLEKIIGRGMMGEVWLATDTTLDRPVAVKALPTILSRDRAAIARLKEEARRCLDLTHSNIVRLVNFEQDTLRGDTPFLVMEYVKGRTLADVLADFPAGLPPETVHRLASDLAAALDYAHQREPAILHRDIKPANIMIAGELKAGVLAKGARALLMDYGIGFEMRSSMTRVTGGQSSSGSPAYMSPQHIQGKPAAHSDDLYSFGVTLYEALSGRVPFPGDGMALMFQIVNQPPPALDRGPPELRDWIIRLLDKDPAKRPARAEFNPNTSNRPIQPPSAAPAASPGKPPAKATPAESAAEAQSFYSRAETYRLGTGGIAKDPAAAFTHYQRAAKAGHVAGTAMLGWCYGTGFGVPQDHAQAATWYRAAAEAGERSAQFNFAVALDNGRGVAQDKAQAVLWFRKAAEQGHPNAQASLGYCLAAGTGTATDPIEAARWFLKAAQQGNITASYNIGNYYRLGKGVEKDLAAAAKWFRAAADGGDPDAQFRLGEALQHGYGIAPDRDAAAAWYAKAAAQGNEAAKTANAALVRAPRTIATQAVPAARPGAGQPNWPTGTLVMPKAHDDITEATVISIKVTTGQRVQKGQVVAEVETDKATLELTADCDGVVTSVYARVGATLKVGDPIVSVDPNAGTPHDFWGAAKSTPATQPSAKPTAPTFDQLVKKGQAGDAAACCAVATALYTGKAPDGTTIPKDEAMAGKWFDAAADRGLPLGLYWKAVFLDNGYGGVRKDPKRAIELYRKAADAGSPEAMSTLGYHMENGELLRKDEPGAVALFSKAAKLGYSDAQLRLGMALQLGRGVSRDFALAAHWYTKAAEQGNDSAQTKLALMLLNGQGIPRDVQAAKKWFGMAAARGDRFAANQLKALG